MSNLWGKDVEEKFFRQALQRFSVDNLFYRVENRHLAYYPKNYRGQTYTIQSRNTLVGAFTESWFENLIKPIAEEKGLYVVRSLVCKELGLTRKSPADVAIVIEPAEPLDELPAEKIRVLFEIKMSIVWNWEYKSNTGELIPVGDYTTHKGNPSLLRSDTMLKAIGKCLNIRISNRKASKIPIFVVGNTPIAESYYEKVDILRKTGIIQHFISINPQPIDQGDTLKSTEGRGFLRIDSYEELKTILAEALKSDLEFFSGMISKKELGKIIEEADEGATLEEKAEIFLKLLRRK